METMRSDSGDPEAVLAAAAKKRKAASSEVAMLDTLGVAAGRGPGKPGKPAPAKPGKAAKIDKPAKRGKRPVLTDDAVPGAPERSPAAGPGLITRGVHVGLRGVEGSVSLGRQMGAWGMSAAAALVAVCVLAGFAAARVPDPAPVRGMRIVYTDGPRLSDRDLFGLIRRYPGLDDLRDGNGMHLATFADWLRGQGAVRSVDSVRYVHTETGERRVVEVTLGLRTPELPVVLATGARAWLDAEGTLLPGIMPAPDDKPRPVLRGIEGASAESLTEALWLWKQLSAVIEPGLITHIALDGSLGLLDQRGIVLGTRSGSRLVWGLPSDANYGIDRERKVSDLVHTIRCQGDLSRIATINVRYQKPFFVLR
jgi:hypothetical protein